jgi:SAM-dependent methyltransferase
MRELVAVRGLAVDKCRALEIGCNTGLGLLELDAALRVGVEPFVLNLEVARVLLEGHIEPPHLVAGDGTAIPLRDAAFDLVFSHHVLEHLPPRLWRPYLAEMARVLRPGGLAFMSFPPYESPWEGHYALPCLHWLPRTVRANYARLTPLASQRRNLELLPHGQLVFEEFPRTREIMAMAGQLFSDVEDVTLAYLHQAPIRAGRRRFQVLAAEALIRLRVFPDRKLLMRR